MLEGIRIVSQVGMLHFSFKNFFDTENCCSGNDTVTDVKTGSVWCLTSSTLRSTVLGVRHHANILQHIYSNGIPAWGKLHYSIMKREDNRVPWGEHTRWNIWIPSFLSDFQCSLAVLLTQYFILPCGRGLSLDSAEVRDFPWDDTPEVTSWSPLCINLSSQKNKKLIVVHIAT